MSRDMTGALFRNDRAEKPAHPSHTGYAEIDGKRYRIAAWVKVSEKSGQRFFSLAFSPAEDKADDRRQQPRPDRGGPNFDSQIPF